MMRPGFQAMMREALQKKVDIVIAIAEADAATRLPELNSATESASGLLGQLLQEQGIHRPLEADV